MERGNKTVSLEEAEKSFDSWQVEGRTICARVVVADGITFKLRGKLVHEAREEIVIAERENSLHVSLRRVCIWDCVTYRDVVFHLRDDTMVSLAVIDEQSNT
jgi:hypothetical protein